MPILNWGTNQTVDLFKSFNPAWSSKVFYIKLLITDNKDFSYGFEIGWDDAQYHEADRYLTLKGPIPYIYGTQVWLSLCLQMS